LLTDDDDLAARARSRDIEVATLRNEHALTEAKRASLTSEQGSCRDLVGLHYRKSSLSLRFANGNDRSSHSMAPQLESLTAAMRAKLVAVTDKMGREEAQYQADDEGGNAFGDLETLASLVARIEPAAGRSILDDIAEDERERYQREINDYPEKFESYLHRCLELINAHRRTIRLDLKLKTMAARQRRKSY
jgi:hypothetical protein